MNAALTDSTVTGFLSSTVKSTIDPVIVGTLNAVPSNFPFKCFNTLPTALAAPVVDGIIGKAPLYHDEIDNLFVWLIHLVIGHLYSVNCSHKSFSTPNASSNTLTIGAKQLVVQLAAETILSSAVKTFSFTP